MTRFVMKSGCLLMIVVAAMVIVDVVSALLQEGGPVYQSNLLSVWVGRLHSVH